MTLTLNRPTPDGIALGRELLRLIEPEIDKLVAAGEPDDRCASCAFRLGTIPNGCAPTVMDALKCALEDRPFYCHMGDGIRRGRVCHGWYAGARRVGRDVHRGAVAVFGWGGRVVKALALYCPRQRCEYKPTSVVSLADHLVQKHEMDRAGADKRAAEVEAALLDMGRGALGAVPIPPRRVERLPRVPPSLGDEEESDQEPPDHPGEAGEVSGAGLEEPEISEPLGPSRPAKPNLTLRDALTILRQQHKRLGVAIRALEAEINNEEQSE